MDLHPSRFRLSDLLSECVAEYRYKAPAEVQIGIKPSVSDYEVELDKMRLNQILNNFMSNALKFTTEGYIELAYEKTDNGIKLSVADTGCGIPQDKQLKIFERFEKLDSFAQGVGLGLSICKSIVEQMGGDIGVESEPGAGSTFWVEIYCQPELLKNTGLK